MILDAAWRHIRAFRAAARRAPAGPLAAFYAAGPVDLSAPDAPMAAIDLETDGLNPRRDAIVELGIVGVADGRLDLSTATRARIRPVRALRAEAVTIHRITDDAVAAAEDEAAVLARVLPLIAGRVLIAHAAQIEARFLNAACLRVFGAPLVAPFVCTLQLETRWFPADRRLDALRLGTLRRAYHLPDYAAHDGLMDAIACGELYLAQRARKGAASMPVSQMIQR